MERIRSKTFARVVYRTRRFEEMIEWYGFVSGAQAQAESPALASLTCDDEHHGFARANLEALRPGDTADDPRGMIGVGVSRPQGTRADLTDTRRFGGTGRCWSWSRCR